MLKNEPTNLEQTGVVNERFFKRLKITPRISNKFSKLIAVSSFQRRISPLATKKPISALQRSKSVYFSRIQAHFWQDHKR